MSSGVQDGSISGTHGLPSLSLQPGGGTHGSAGLGAVGLARTRSRNQDLLRSFDARQQRTEDSEGEERSMESTHRCIGVSVRGVSKSSSSKVPDHIVRRVSGVDKLNCNQQHLETCLAEQRHREC